jgi:hypothetical protein
MRNPMTLRGFLWCSLVIAAGLLGCTHSTDRGASTPPSATADQRGSAPSPSVQPDAGTMGSGSGSTSATMSQRDRTNAAPGSELNDTDRDVEIDETD